MARDNGKGAESAEEKRKREQAAAIVRSVEDAIAAGEFDEAARLAGGHPDPVEHQKLIERIATATTAAGAPEFAQASVDLAGPVPKPGDDKAVHLRAFTVAGQTAKLRHLNLRAERHGNDEVPCIDAKFELNLASTILDLFDPALRAFLFHKSADPQDLADQAHEAPNLRIRELKPLEWSRDIHGGKLKVAYGISDASAIVLGNVRATGFRMEPLEGGTVRVTFVVKAQHVDGDEVARLAMLIKRECSISFTPPDTGWHVEEDDGADDED